MDDLLLKRCLKNEFSGGEKRGRLEKILLFWVFLLLLLLLFFICFTLKEINTNPSYVDEGKLRILPNPEFTAMSSSHGCSLCPPNMCKGKIIERMQESSKGNRFIYLGDGKGDYCPMVKLNETDYAMPGKNYPVWDLIISNPEKIKAEVHEWGNGEDLKNVLLK